MTNMEAVTQSLVGGTLQKLASIQSGKAAKVSIAECSLVCILADGSFAHVALSWELHYQSMKQGMHMRSSSRCASVKSPRVPCVDSFQYAEQKNTAGSLFDTIKLDCAFGGFPLHLPVRL